MELLQNILVIICGGIAALYLIQKFIWKPSFLESKSSRKNCGESDCGCH